jgi:hypothetical protein
LGRGSKILATTGFSHSLAFSIAINAILNRQTVYHVRISNSESCNGF